MKIRKAEKEKRTEEKLFLYGQFITWVLCFFIMIWLRARMVWMGEIMPLGFIYSVYVLLILAVLFSILHLSGGNNVTVLDCIAVGTLPVTVYINTVTIIIFPWMRSIGIVYVMLMFICIIVMCMLNKYKKNKGRIELGKSVWGGLCLWSFMSITLVVICILLCRKKMDEIEAQQYLWLCEEVCQTEENDIELNNLKLTDFRHDRFEKLTMGQRRYLVELLVHKTMLFLTDGAVNPDVEHTTNNYGKLGEAYYDEMEIHFDIDLYSPRDEEDVRELVNVIFHECFHIYEHYCVDTLCEGENGSSAFYYRQIKAWEKNEENYIQSKSSVFEYQHQPLESDATAFSEVMTDRFMEYVYQ